jgi:hypothetical protein
MGFILINKRFVYGNNYSLKVQENVNVLSNRIIDLILKIFKIVSTKTLFENEIIEVEFSQALNYVAYMYFFSKTIITTQC